MANPAPSLEEQLRMRGLTLGSPAPPPMAAPPPADIAPVMASPAMEAKLREQGVTFVTGTGAERATAPMTGAGFVQRIQQGLQKAGAVNPPPESAASNDLAPPPAAPAPPPGMPVMGGGGGGGGAPAEMWRVGPQVRAAYGAADESARHAIDENTALGLAGAEREQEAYRQGEENLAIQNAKSEQAEKERASKTQAYQEQYDRLADQVAGAKIDPNRAWSSKSAAGKIGSVIHDALRGFLIGAGAGDIGGTLQQEIDRDIEVQKADLANKRAGAEARRGALAMALQRFGDERTAEAAAKASLADQLRARLGTLAAQSKSDQVKENANTAIAALNEQKAQHLNAMMAYGMTGGGGGGGGATGTVKMSDDQFIPLGDGTGIMARSGKEGEQLRAKQAAAAGIISNLQALAELEKNATLADKANPYSDYNEKRTQYIADTSQMKTVYAGQGSQSQGDKVITDAANGAITGLHRLKDNSGLINNAIATIQKNADLALKGQGGMVVQQVYGRDARGQIVPRYVPVQAQYRGVSGAAPPPASFKAAGGKK